MKDWLKRQRKKFGEKQAELKEKAEYRKIGKKQRKEIEEARKVELKRIEKASYRTELSRLAESKKRKSKARATARGKRRARLESRGVSKRFANIGSTLGTVGSAGAAFLLGSPEPRKSKPRKTRQPQQIVIKVEGARTPKSRAKTARHAKKKQKDPIEELMGF